MALQHRLDSILSLSKDMCTLQDLCMNALIKCVHKPAHVLTVDSSRVKIVPIEIWLQITNTLTDDISVLQQLSLPEHLKETLVELRKSTTVKFLANDIRSFMQLSHGIDMMTEESLKRAFHRRFILSSPYAHILFQANEYIETRRYPTRIVVEDLSEVDFEPGLDHIVNFKISQCYPERLEAGASLLLHFKISDKPFPSMSSNFVLLEQLFDTSSCFYKS